MPTFLQLIKSKTLWVSLAAICTGVGAFLGGEGSGLDIVLALYGLAMFILRFYTRESLHDK